MSRDVVDGRRWRTHSAAGQQTSGTDNSGHIESAIGRKTEGLCASGGGLRLRGWPALGADRSGGCGWKSDHPLGRCPSAAKQTRPYGRRSFFQRGAPPPPIGPGPLPRGWDDGQGDDPPECVSGRAGYGSGPVQRISCSHTRRTPSPHTSPPVIEIGTPSQKPQPAQLASHHDMRSPNSVTAATSVSAPTYSHRTSSGAKRR